MKANSRDNVDKMMSKTVLGKCSVQTQTSMESMQVTSKASLSNLPQSHSERENQPLTYDLTKVRANDTQKASDQEDGGGSTGVIEKICDDKVNKVYGASDLYSVPNNQPFSADATMAESKVETSEKPQRRLIDSFSSSLFTKAGFLGSSINQKKNLDDFVISGQQLLSNSQAKENSTLLSSSSPNTEDVLSREGHESSQKETSALRNRLKLDLRCKGSSSSSAWTAFTNMSNTDKTPSKLY
ncbi:hypothetical protein BSL78_29052 [Apostichopus japonicus]|uniref:Uncharacterized protein n=1 Tax=Stichopus japonicus TaxID=307972 RepID=A0A2G8JEI9_STIJA|nr:hypothetical protein BSL78_29052 [Apostichopus japonicus]